MGGPAGFQCFCCSVDDVLGPPMTRGVIHELVNLVFELWH